MDEGWRSCSCAPHGPLTPATSSAGVDELHGVVASGRGRAAHDLAACEPVLYQALGATPYPGTLNLLLPVPVRLRAQGGYELMPFQRAVWPARIDTEPVWIYRWKSAPLHVIELVGLRCLRRALALENGAMVTVTLPAGRIAAAGGGGRIAWWLLWRGREQAYYRSRLYAPLAEGVGMTLGAAQGGPGGVLGIR